MSRNRARGRASRPVQLVRPVPLDPTGRNGPTRGQARGPRWRRTSHGLHVPVSVCDDLPEQRILEQSMRLPTGGAVTGWAAGRLRGAGYLDGRAADGTTRLPGPLCIGPRGSIRGDDAVQLLRHELAPDEVTSVLGIPCVAAERGALDAVRGTNDLVEAVVQLDMLMLGELTSLRRLRAYARQLNGVKGARRFGTALGLADEHSWSPNETRTRTVWRREAGLPPPLVNRPIFDRRGRLLGYPDLLDVESGLVCEYDGADHRGAARHSDDVRREAVFRSHALEVTRVTGPDLLVRGRVRHRILEARDRALWLPEDKRPWTTVAPPGWDGGPSLDRLLDERDAFLESERAFAGSGW